MGFFADLWEGLSAPGRNRSNANRRRSNACSDRCRFNSHSAARLGLERRAGNRWTIPVSAEIVKQARRGQLELLLTPTTPVPANWYPPLKDTSVLCLASGGGQQGPMLAARIVAGWVLQSCPLHLDDQRAENGSLEVRHSIPYSDLRDLNDADRKRLILDKTQPLEFGHSLEDQIGGQLDAGFVLTGFYEDRYEGAENDPISQYIATFIATRAVKPTSHVS